MNKLTKLMLASAMMITSGFAAGGGTGVPSSNYGGGNLNVGGTFTQVSDASVSGKINVQSDGMFDNNAKLIFTGSGELVVATQTIGLAEYESANNSYSLGIAAVNAYTVGSCVGALSQTFDWNNVLNFEKEDWNYDGNNKLTNAKVLGSDYTFPAKLSVGGASSSVTWACTPQTEKSFREAVRAAILDSNSATEDVKKQFQEDCEDGTFDNSDGTLDLTNAGDGKTFSGTINGGNVLFNESVKADLSNLKLVNSTVTFGYNSTRVYSAPTVNESTKHLEVSVTGGLSAEGAEALCKGKIHSNSEITFTGNATGGEDVDNRLSFPDMLASDTSNLNTNLLQTSTLGTVVKGYDDSGALSVNNEIKVKISGSDAVKFVDGKEEGSDHVVAFSGDNSGFTGEASFSSDITKVAARSDNALPEKMTENMSNITLDIDGKNKLDAEGKTIVVKDLILGSNAEFTVSAGTSLTVGGAAS